MVLRQPAKLHHDRKKNGHGHGHKSRSPSKTAQKHSISPLSHIRSDEKSRVDLATRPAPKLLWVEGKKKWKWDPPVSAAVPVTALTPSPVHLPRALPGPSGLSCATLHIPGHLEPLLSTEELLLPYPHSLILYGPTHTTVLPSPVDEPLLLPPEQRVPLLHLSPPVRSAPPLLELSLESEGFS